MSRLIRPVLAIAAAVLVTGCASLAPPIRLEATPGALEVLTGEWYGDYAVKGPYGRRGTIAFTLAAGEDHAHGDVLMIPEGATRGYMRVFGEDPWVHARAVARHSQVLTIRFVRAADGFLDGQLDPYWDPDRDCVATTTFRGTLGDRVMSGTFSTTFASGEDAVFGEWKVTRVPARSR
jgi:hypothetical protein